ncbi:MAG TPA: hypothetical protein VMZ53_06940 [Kofleriaceae bacterium]|nr:hypothetical protein [Kofleriaceae bacterium]
MGETMKKLFVCLMLVGCGGDGAENVPIDNLGPELAAASCSKQFDCCTDAEIMEQYMGITIDGQPITTEEQCVSFTNAFFTGFAVSAWKESIAQGRMEYDGDAAGACVALINGVSCSEYANGPDLTEGDCRPFLIPKVANDGACSQDYECTSDNCVGAMTSNGVKTDGMCKPMPGAGQPCDDNCADGYFCDYDQTANMDICQATKPIGADCFLDEDCASDYCDDVTDMCGMKPLTCDGR